MDIQIPVSKDHKTTMGQRVEHTDPKIVLKEGRILHGTVIAKENEQVLLKIADLFVRAEAEGLLSNQKGLLLKVDQFLPDKIVMTALEQTQASLRPAVQMPDIKISFSVPESSLNQLAKMAITPGQTVAAKLMVGNDQQLMIKVHDQLLPVKPDIVFFEARNIMLQPSPGNRLYLIENGKVITQEPVTQQTPGSSSEAGKNTQNHQLLKEMIRQEQSFMSPNSNTALMSETKEQVVKVVVDGQSLNRPDQYMQQSNTLKELPVDAKLLKNLFFEPDAKASEVIRSAQVRTGQESLSVDRMSYNPKTELVEAFFKDNKLLFKPELEFKDNIPLFLKTVKDNGKTIFQVDPQTSKENQQLLQQLHVKLGQIIVEDENNAEIIKKIIENKLPLTKDNIKTIQNFIQQSPIDAKTSIDFLINQNLLFGLFYQMNDLNDQFLLKGMQKKNRQNQKEAEYEFTILYESETLGSILIEILWLEKLAINFYCADQQTCDKIINTMDELKESIQLPDISLHAETNPEIIKKEPVSTEKIVLSNVDLTV